MEFQNNYGRQEAVILALRLKNGFGTLPFGNATVVSALCGS